MAHYQKLLLLVVMVLRIRILLLLHDWSHTMVKWLAKMLTMIYISGTQHLCLCDILCLLSRKTLDLPCLCICHFGGTTKKQ